MMFHILCGKYPFGSGLKAVPKILAAQKPKIPGHVRLKSQFKPLADELIEIIYACLEKDPNARPSADELVAKCSLLCYTVSTRYIGEVYEFKYNAYGNIKGDHGPVFYHKNSVFGSEPKVGDSVLFSCYEGGQRPRALPVLKLKKSK